MSGEDVKFTRRDYSYIPGREEIAMRILAELAGKYGKQTGYCVPGRSYSAEEVIARYAEEAG